MRSGYTWLLCCGVLISVWLCSPVIGEISEDGRRVLDQLRLKHQSAEAETGRPGLRGLAEQLRQKNAKNKTKQKTEPPPIKVPSVNAEELQAVTAEAAGSGEAIASVEVPDQTTLEDAAGQSDISAPSGAAETQSPSVLAEKYDHVPADTAPANASTRAVSAQSGVSKKADDLSFGSFLFAVVTCIVLFQFGAGFINIDSKKEPGCFAFTGLAMLIGGALVAMTAITKFWPFLLILGFCTLFSQSKPSSDSGCGCLATLALIFLIFALF